MAARGEWVGNKRARPEAARRPQWLSSCCKRELTLLLLSESDQEKWENQNRRVYGSDSS